jgi:HK97 family phage major capsid protein
MKKSDQIKQRLASKKAEKRRLANSAVDLRAKVEKEKRALTDEEQALIDDIKAQAETLVAEIAELEVALEAEVEAETEAETEARRKSNQGKDPESRAFAPVTFDTKELGEDQMRSVNAFSFAKAMRQAKAGGLDGVELEMHQEGQKEMRNAQASPQGGPGVIVPMVVLRNKKIRSMSVTGGTGGNKGGNTLRDEPIDYISLLKAKTPLFSQYGVRFVTDLSGNLPLVRQTQAVDFGWEGEEEENNLTDMTLARYELKPHRLSGTVRVSDQLLIQSSLDVESMINEDILSSHQVIIQKAIINGAGTDQPLGLLNDPDVITLALGADGGTLDWPKVLNLIQALDDENSLLNDPKFLLGTRLRTALKSASIDAGSGLKIWDLVANTIDGYMADTSNIVPKNLEKGAKDNLTAMIFAQWSEYLFAQWGGFEIIYDPYTRARNGQKQWTLNVFHDGVARRPKSFALYKDVEAGTTGTESES